MESVFWQSPIVVAATISAIVSLTGVLMNQLAMSRQRKASLEQIERAAEKEMAKIYNSKLHEIKIDRYTQILLHFSKRASGRWESIHERDIVLFLFASDEVVTDIIATPEVGWGKLQPDIFQELLDDFGRARAMTYAESWGEIALAMRKDVGHPATRLTKDSFVQFIEALYRQR